MKLKAGMEVINGHGEIFTLIDNDDDHGDYVFKVIKHKNFPETSFYYTVTKDGYYFNSHEPDIDDVRPLTKLDKALR